MKLKQYAVVTLIASTLALSGCGAMSTAVKKRNLEVKTQMSETIWLEPSSEKTVYLQIRNTSDKDMSGLQSQITSELAAKGYRVTSSPDGAYFWIQANVLKAEKMDLREAQGFLKTGYEGAAMGAALGAGITAYNSSSAGATLGVGLATGLIGMAADAMVEDVNYTMVTDLQISERSKAKVTTDNIAALKQEPPVLRCRPVQKRETGQNIRPAWYPTPTRLTSNLKRQNPFWKRSWPNPSPALCNPFQLPVVRKSTALTMRSLISGR